MSRLLARIAALPLPLRGAIFAACVAFVLWASLSPNDEVPFSQLFWDKAEHALGYLILTAVGLTLFPTRGSTVFFGVVALGVGVEVAQANMNLGRQGDWRDATANAAGALIAVRLAQYLRWRSRRRGVGTPEPLSPGG